MTITDVLLAVGRSDERAALEAARAAALAAPTAQLPQQLVQALEAERSGDVYVGTEALTRFISGGSNRRLYAALEAELHARHLARPPAALLDLGCGDGRVTRSVLVDGTQSVDLVEPSAALLELAVDAFADGPWTCRGHTADAAAFFAGAGLAGRWDAVQSTFALHTMPPDERADVLAAIAARTGRLLVAEFDVPDFEDGSRAHADYVAERYERGLQEYPGDDVVAQGFLLPVLIGQFAPDTIRHTFEQSADRWVRELRAAGFTDVSVAPLAPYWWADAVLLDARR